MTGEGTVTPESAVHGKLSPAIIRKLLLPRVAGQQHSIEKQKTTSIVFTLENYQVVPFLTAL